MIPVCIVSGYLGAGKTTLIRDFLQSPGPWRACVMVNDFGKINLDAALIRETGADTIALTNGCACCTIGDDLLAGVKKIMDGPVAYDLIIVEASGVSQPGRIAMLLAGVAGTEPARCLTVVNMSKAVQLAKDKFVGRLFHQQTRQADGLSLNRLQKGLPGQDDLLPGDTPRYTSLQDFVGADSRCVLQQEEVPTGEAAPLFRQEFISLHNMTEEKLRRFCAGLPKRVHRAKGFVSLDPAEIASKAVQVDVVQGALSVVPISEIPEGHESGLVVITSRE